MYRILPVILIVTAGWLHVACCEWHFSDETQGLAASASERVIYYRHRSSTFRRRGDYLPRNVLLLARRNSDKKDAQLNGILLPALLVGGAAAVFYIERQSGKSFNP